MIYMKGWRLYSLQWWQWSLLFLRRHFQNLPCFYSGWVAGWLLQNHMQESEMVLLIFLIISIQLVILGLKLNNLAKYQLAHLWACDLLSKEAWQRDILHIFMNWSDLLQIVPIPCCFIQWISICWFLKLVLL